MSKIKGIALITGVLVMGLFMAYLAIAWTEPGDTPPGGQVPAPINVGPNLQYKSGALGVGGLEVDQNVNLAVLGGKVGIGTTTPAASHSEPDKVGLDVADQIITGVKAPIDDSDAVPKSYVIADTGGGGAGVFYITSNCASARGNWPSEPVAPDCPSGWSEVQYVNESNPDSAPVSGTCLIRATQPLRNHASPTCEVRIVICDQELNRHLRTFFGDFAYCRCTYRICFR